MIKRVKTGRKPVFMTCQLCRRKMQSTQMRLHEPTCRRERLLKVGARFHVSLNGKIVPVEITDLLDGVAVACKNLETGRTIRLKSYRRFREWMDRANVRFNRTTEAQA